MLQALPCASNISLVELHHAEQEQAGRVIRPELDQLAGDGFGRFRAVVFCQRERHDVLRFRIVWLSSHQPLGSLHCVLGPVSLQQGPNQLGQNLGAIGRDLISPA